MTNGKYILRTMNRQGDWVQFKQYTCMIRACSTAELYSDNTIYGNVTVTNIRTRKSLCFVNGNNI